MVLSSDGHLYYLIIKQPEISYGRDQCNSATFYWSASTKPEKWTVILFYDLIFIFFRFIKWNVVPWILKIMTCLFVAMPLTLSNKNKYSVQIGSSGLKCKKLLIM